MLTGTAGREKRRPVALQLLVALAVLPGLVQRCSGAREGPSITTPKLLKLQQEQAVRDAEWKPVRMPRLAASSDGSPASRSCG